MADRGASTISSFDWVEYVEGVERGLRDIRAGRLVDHEAAMDELDEVIERTSRRVDA